MEYLGIADLFARWVYSRQGIHRLVKTASFPKPVFTVNAGRVPVWQLPEIEAYEAKHLELFDHRLKRRKQTGYALAKQKGFPESATGDSAR